MGGWGIILGWIPPLFGDIWSHKTSKTLFLLVIFSILCLLFSQYGLKSKSPHFSEKSIPGLPRLEPHRKVNATTLDFFHNLLKLNSPILFFVGRSRGLPENPWGGKSMENPWKIHEQIQGFWKLRFRQKVKD